MAESSGEKKRSNFKMFLALFLIAGIVGLLAYGNKGDNAVSSVLGRFTNIGAGGDAFDLRLSTDATVLYGNSFALSGSDITISGVCNVVNIGELTIERENTRCTIQTSGYSGKFDYTPFGSIVLAGQSSAVKLDTYTYSSGKPVNFEVEIIPMGMFVTGISKSKLSMVAPFGEIAKFSNGELKGVSYLSGTPLDINNLNGNIELKDGVLTITGAATAVKSTEFTW